MTSRKSATKKKALSFMDAPSMPAEKVAKFIYENTVCAYGSLLNGTKNGKPLSEKAQKIQDYINTHLSGSYRRHAANLFSELLGETIAIKSSIIEEFVASTMLVPIGNDNNHDYPLNKPALRVSGSRANTFMKWSNGFLIRGNNMTTTISNLRLPTPEEVLEFVKVDEEQVMSALGVVVL